MPETITFIIPTLGRSDGLQRCKESIRRLNYPQDLINIIEMPGDKSTVPEKMKGGVKHCKADYICYAANDMTFEPDCIVNALRYADGKRLISFNEGPLLPDKGNICTHFMIKRDLIDEIGGEIFSTRMSHTGVDDLLWAKCDALGEAYYCEQARINHYHFSKGGKLDDVYEKGWSKVEQDRAILKEELAKIEYIPRKIFTFWLGSELPAELARCVETQKIPGYTHQLVTLDNCIKGYEYVDRAIAARKWVKAVDYLRMLYLYLEGGITLDADVEMLPGKNFDGLLRNKMFAEREENGFIGNAIMGSKKGHPFVEKWVDDVTENFEGDDDKIFEAAMDILVRGYFEKGWDKDGFVLVPSKTLYPYNHQTGVTSITADTLCIHHFIKSWK